MPRYIHFINCVVDSDDLPLNVSRQQLQQYKMIKVMSKKLVKASINVMIKLAIQKDDDDDDYDDDDDEEENKPKVMKIKQKKKR